MCYGYLLHEMIAAWGMVTLQTILVVACTATKQIEPSLLYAEDGHLRK